MRLSELKEGFNANKVQVPISSATIKVHPVSLTGVEYNGRPKA